MRLGHVADVGGSADDGMHPPSVGIDTNIRFRAEVPLITILGVMHFFIAFVATWKSIRS